MFGVCFLGILNLGDIYITFKFKTTVNRINQR